MKIKKYFSQRKKEDTVYENLLSLKYGFKHERANSEEVEDYLNKIRSEAKNLNHYSMDDYFDITSEAIPKKVKKPELHIINHTNKTEKSEESHRYDKIKNELQNSAEGSSQFIYSSITNDPIELLKSSNFPKIEEPKQVAGIISAIKKDNKLEIRKELSIALDNISNPNCLTRFLQLNGTTHLGYWIDDYREEIETKDNINHKVFDILHNILNFCDKLPISVHDLKISKIGKKINKLGKCLEGEREIKSKCEELVLRWKKMLENLKDKQPQESQRREKESRYINSNEISDEKTTPDVLLSPTKNSSNQIHFSENFSMRKTQRSEVESGDKNYKKYISITMQYFITICLLFKTLHINSLNILFVFID